MYTKNLTVREMYASIGSTDFIVTLFKEGLTMNNDRLAVSAMEELLHREDSESIVECLEDAFRQQQIAAGSSLVNLIANSLSDGAREIDPILCNYGKGLIRGEFVGPSEFVRNHAEQYRKCYRSGAVRKAKPWAAKEIWAGDPNGKYLSQKALYVS